MIPGKICGDGRYLGGASAPAPAYKSRFCRKGASEVEGDRRHPQGAPHPPPATPASTGFFEGL